MKTTQTTIKSALITLSLALFGAVGIAACAAPVESGEPGESGGAPASQAEEEQVGEAEGALPSQCCYGYYRCPTTGAKFNYYSGPAASCYFDPLLSLSAASSACNAACGPACTNTQTGCYPIN